MLFDHASQTSVSQSLDIAATTAPAHDFAVLIAVVGFLVAFVIKKLGA